MARQILFDAQARKHLKAGMDMLAEAVGVTLGPRGRYVVIERKHDTPILTRDGGEVAKHLRLKAPFPEMGVNLLRRVAIQVGKKVGDGISMSIVLAHSLIDSGIKNLVSGAHPMDMKAGMDLAVSRAVAHLKGMGEPVHVGSRELEYVARVAANQDADMGRIVAEAMGKAGSNGLITIEPGQGRESLIEMKEGMQFDRGFISPFFITDMANMEAVLEDPYILIYDRKITDTRDLLPILNECASQGRSLLIIAEAIEENPLTTLVLNKIRGRLKIAAIRSPGFGDHRCDMLEDAAAFTSGTVLSAEKGNLLKYASLDTLGRTDKAILSRDHTALILDHQGSNDRVADRIHEIQTRLKNNPSLADKKVLEERLSRLSGSAAVIKIGASTRTELAEKKARANDALHASKAALEEGILPGGGVAFIRTQQALEDLRGMNPDQNTGIQMVRRALEEPMRRIIINTGTEVSESLYRVKQSSGAFGFNVQNLQYEDLLKAGIPDAVKVLRIALETAVSIAGAFLTLECAIAEDTKASRKL